MKMFGKWLIVFGLLFIGIGILFWVGTKLGIAFGKLPGDIHIQKGKSTVYFPIVTCLILSLLLTLLINLLVHIFHKK
jgi:hypothetical protein